MRGKPAEGGILAIFDSIIFDGPGVLAGAIGRGFNALSNGFGLGEGESQGDSMSFSLGSLFGFGGDDNAPQISAPVQQPALAMNTASLGVTQFDFDPSDLGTMSPQNFSNQTIRSNDMGMSSVG